MFTRSTIAALFAFAVLAGCAGDRSTAPLSSSSRSPAAAKPTANPTATWLIPLNDAALSLRSDHNAQFSDGTYSRYANGECSFTSTIFLDGTGDNTFGFSYPRNRTCGRTWTVVYPDAYSETLAY